jgi:uncharacterized protein (TIGR03083 family)
VRAYRVRMPSRDELIDWIETESDAFAATIRADALDHRVPGCPEWTLRELVWHLGAVQRFWARDVRRGADVEPDFEDTGSGPREATDLGAWMRASTRELMHALHDISWETPAWTWWKAPRNVGAIARHQAQEAAVHRWDAQSATNSSAAALPDALAADGVEEFLEIARQLRDPTPITFVATDTGGSFPLSAGASRATVSATATDLVLVLYGRRTLDEVAVEGDRSVVEAFLLPIE